MAQLEGIKGILYFPFMLALIEIELIYLPGSVQGSCKVAGR
jgi:hypothetical protein